MKYIGYGYGLKLGGIWIPLWGKLVTKEEIADFGKQRDGFHRVSYLKTVRRGARITATML